MEKFNKKNINLDDFRFGGDQEAIDSNPALKDYLRVLYDQIKYENKMVGEFSVFGTYSIEPKMKDYLIKEIKFFQERKGDVVYATRVLENLVLNFKITFNIVGNSQQAFLDIEERELRLDEDNIIHRTRLAEIVKVGHPDFVNYVYKEWNVWLSVQDLAYEDNALLRNLFERISMFNALGSILGMNSISYVSSILSLLPLCGAKGILISNQFNQMLSLQVKKNPAFANNGLGMKRLLDQIMLKNGFFSQLATLKDAIPVFKEFVQPLRSLDMSSIKIPSISKSPKTFDGPSLDK